MTPIEIIKDLVSHDPMMTEGKGDARKLCSICWKAGGHANDCTWLAMPKVVDVIEAAEALVRALGKPGPWYPGSQDRRTICRCCGNAVIDEGHAEDCPWKNLVDALKVGS